MGSEVKLGSPVSLHQTGEAEQRQTAASPVRKGFSRVTNTAAVGAECCRVRWGGWGVQMKGEMQELNGMGLLFGEWLWVPQAEKPDRLESGFLISELSTSPLAHSR